MEEIVEKAHLGVIHFLDHLKPFGDRCQKVFRVLLGIDVFQEYPYAAALNQVCGPLQRFNNVGVLSFVA